MLRLLFFLTFFTSFYTGFSQASDLLSVRRKNGRVIKTFTGGSFVRFRTKDKTYQEGLIKQVRNDSVFLTRYDVRQYPTAWGTRIVDTIATYIVATNYKDIESIEVFTYKRFVRGKIDRLLIIGGAGYFTLNVLNGGLLNEKITERSNLRKLGISIAAVGMGLIIKKYFYVNKFSRRKHKIVYIKIT